MAATGILLLRYRFDSPAQLRWHARLADGRVLMFYPDPLQQGRTGEKAVLELAFAGSDQTMTFAASVHSRTMGDLAGVWLELHGARVVDDVRFALHAPRRAHRRIAFDAIVRVQTARRPNSLGRLKDVSLAGARISGLDGDLLPGEEIRLGESGRTLSLRARVSWSRAGTTAVEFLRADPVTLAAGSKLAAAASARWASVRTLSHPASCRCDRGGHVLEPLRPRATHLRSLTA